MSTSIEQLTALMLLIDFLFGTTLGVVGGAVIGSRRGALAWSTADGPFSAGARTIFGVYTHVSGNSQPAGDASADPDLGAERKQGSR